MWNNLLTFNYHKLKNFASSSVKKHSEAPSQLAISFHPAINYHCFRHLEEGTNQIVGIVTTWEYELLSSRKLISIHVFHKIHNVMNSCVRSTFYDVFPCTTSKFAFH